MNRFVRPIVVLLCVTSSGVALAQAPQQATPGRPAFVPVPVVIGPPAPVPPEVAIPRPTAAELVQVNDAVKTFIDRDTSSTKPLLKKFESLLMLQPRAPERRRHLHADGAAAGAEARGVRRDCEARQHRPAAARRLDHRLVGAGRRQQGDVRQSTSARMRTANFAVSGDTTQGVLWGLKQRRRPGVSTEGDHADDRHEQQRREHRT